ncbi:MAG TPA: MOSC N-terminal beta barrel domain-containing protein, partial [Planctomycetaceae bacterium]
MSVRLVRIDLFPIKSFDPVSVGAVRVLPSGSLENDRRFAVFDRAGRFVNGKRTPLVHALRTSFDDAFEEVTIADRRGGRSETFPLADGRPAIEARLSEHFGEPVTFCEDARTGFPDDTIASGPTVIAAETLAVVADWFGLTFDDARRRFRANL